MHRSNCLFFMMVVARLISVSARSAGRREACTASSFITPRRPRPSHLFRSIASSSRVLSDGLEDPAGPKPNDRQYAESFGDEHLKVPISYTPIAVARSPFKERHGAPRQPNVEGKRGQNSGTIQLLPENLGGIDNARLMLKDLDTFSHVHCLFDCHLNTGWNALVTPPRLRHLESNAEKKKGVLATRAPHRPNNIGLSILKVESIDIEKLVIHTRSTDMIEGTPVLDLKPYIKEIDSFPTASSGWIEEIEKMEMRGEIPKVTHDGGAEQEEALKHRKSYSISGTGRRSAVAMTTNTGHELFTDVPQKMGGSDTAPQPVEHLLAALIGCAQATAIFVGRSMKPRLLIDKIEFDIQANRDARGALQQPIEETPDIPARLQYVSGTARVFFKGNDNVSLEQLQLLSEQTEARCPVANMMLASGCTIDIQWENGSPSA